MKRNTFSTVERMKTAKITCWIETHRRMKRSLTLRTASLPDVQWTKNAAEWNPGRTRQWDDRRNK